MADITARFRLDISGIDAALTRVAAATLAAQGAFAAANAALAPLQGAFAAIKDSLDLGGRLSDVSAQTGIAVSDLVVLRQAFANAGLGADAVGPAINRLQKAIAGVNEDGEPTRRTFPPGDFFARAAIAFPSATICRGFPGARLNLGSRRAQCHRHANFRAQWGVHDGSL